MKHGDIIPEVDETEKYQCFHMFCAGWTFREIAKDTGINLNRIKGWSHKFGWNNIKHGIEKERRKRATPFEKTPLAKVFATDSRDEIVKRFEGRVDRMADKDSEHWEKKMTPRARLKQAQNLAAAHKMYRSGLGLDKDEQGQSSLISLTFLGNPEAVRLLPTAEPQQIEDAK